MSLKLLGLVAIFCLCGPVLAREKVDVIHLLNGDRITGEIKKLEYGKLRFSTDSMGTLQIEWDDIATVSSEYAVEFELSDGQRYFEKLERGAQPSVLILNTASAPTMLAFDQVVRITPIEDSFWGRLGRLQPLHLGRPECQNCRPASNLSEAYRSGSLLCATRCPDSL